MAHYLIAQYNGGRYRENGVLSAESIKLMHSPRTDLRSRYGMGWFAQELGGIRVIRHRGDLDTFIFSQSSCQFPIFAKPLTIKGLGQAYCKNIIRFWNIVVRWRTPGLMLHTGGCLSKKLESATKICNTRRQQKRATEVARCP